MNKKQITALALTAAMVSPIGAVKANTVVNHTAYNKIIIKGFIPVSDRAENYYNSRCVNITLKNGGNIVFADETEIDNDGNYDIMLKLDKSYNIDDCKLNVKIGNKSAESTVVSAVAVDESLLNIPITKENVNGQTEITADFTDVAKMSDDDYTVILAAYDDNGALKNTKFITDSVQKDGGASYLNYKFSEEYSSVKLFVWQSTESMLPLATTTDGSISFGTQYSKQETEGYKNLEEQSKTDCFTMDLSTVANWKDKNQQLITESGITAEKVEDNGGDWAKVTYPAEMTSEVMVNLRDYSGQVIEHDNKRLRFEYDIKVPEQALNQTIMSFTTGGATYEKIRIKVSDNVNSGKVGLYFETRTKNNFDFVTTPIVEGEDFNFNQWINLKFDVDFVGNELRLYDGLNVVKKISLKSNYSDDLSVKKEDKLFYFGLTCKNTGSEPMEFGVRNFKISRVAADESTTYGRYAAAKAEISDEAQIVSVPYVTSRTNIYVSPTGKSGGDGSLDNPFGSLEEAVNSIKTYSDENKKAWKTIYLMGGDYLLDSEIKIDETLAADGDAKLVIKPYNNEKVAFTCAKIVSGDKFKKVTAENTEAEEYNRLNASAVDNIYYCDYSDLGVSTFDDFTSGSPGRTPTVEYNGINATIARFPNVGESKEGEYTNGESNIKEILNNGGTASKEEKPTAPVFVPTDTRFSTWKNPDNKIGMYGQMCVSWNVNSSLVEIDKENKTVTLPAGVWGWSSTSSYNGIQQNVGYDPPVKSHFYYYNILEELDLPYEWCAEDAQQRLYFYAPNGSLDANDEIKIKANKGISNMLNIKSVKNVIIDGIDFENANTAVKISNSENVIVNNALIKNVTGGVAISDSKKCGIINSEIQNASTGVSISEGAAGFTKLTPSRNFVQNNHFNNSRYGVSISSNGNIVSHNLAENYEATMIYITAGAENIVEYNESVAGCQKGEEGGLVYIGGQYNCRHNHIRYNYFHNNSIPGEERVYAGAVVIDDLGECEYVYGNVVESVKRGIGANGGDGHVIDDNVVLDTDIALTTNGQYSNTYNNMYKGSLSKYFLTGDIQKSQYLTHYYSMKLNESEAWNTRYPYLKERLAWFEHIDDLWQAGNDISNEDVKFFINTTGYVVTDNTLQASRYVQEHTAHNYVEDKDVKNGEKATLYGDTNFEYSVDHNNTVLGENAYYDIKQILSEKLGNNFGLKNRTPKYTETDSKIKILNESGTDGVMTGKTLSLGWLKRSDANYYVVTVATDSEFKNIVATEKTFKTGCGINLETEGTYYYKVEGVSMKANDFGKVTSSSNE